MADWKLSHEDGTSYKLPTTMVFVGSSECDINIESEGIDKRHAVITFDHYQNKFKIKDLGSSAGTYLNDRRIPDQTYITIDEGDSIKLGSNESKPFQVEKTLLGDSVSYKISQSHSMDTISSHTSSANTPSDEQQAHTPLSRSSSRPKWDQRPSLAECQGCIKEQDLHHSCGANSDLETVHVAHCDGGRQRSPALSPLDLSTQPNSRQSPVPQHRDKVPIMYQEYHPHHQQHVIHDVEERMPLDPILNTHVNKHHESRASNMTSSHHHQSFTPQRRAVDIIHADVSFSGTAVKKSTPLYGQPSWWGENDADEHNKQLLKDIQSQREQEKQQKSANAAEVTKAAAAVSSSRSSPPNPPKNMSAVLTGGDGSKPLSFTVDLEDSLEEQEEVSELPMSAGGEKLSNFLPENLRKSFRERRERLSMSAERSAERQKDQQSSTNQKNSPGNPRKSKSPTRTKSPARKSPQSKSLSSSNNQQSNTADDNPSMFLINKMFYTPPDKAQGQTRVKDTDEETEYSMYSEARALNRSSQQLFYHGDEDRSSTMPELVQSPHHPSLTKSRTFDDGDKVSESGTYTIDEDNKDLQEAREEIDKVFGLSTETSPNDTGGEEINGSPDKNELNGANKVVNGSLNVELGSTKTEDTYTVQPSVINKSEDEAKYSSGEILRKLGDKSESPVINTTAENNHHNSHSNADTSDAAALGKPPISPTFRTRSPERQSSPVSLRSTGRKLPEVPTASPGTGSEEVRHSTEVTVGRSNTMPRRRKEVEYNKEKILQELGIGDTPVIEKERPRLVEELLTSRTYHRDNDPIVVNKTNFFDKIISSSSLVSPERSKSPPQTAYSDSKPRQSHVGGSSVDTEVLLQSTDEFMKAIHSFSSDNESSTPRTAAANNKTKKSLKSSTIADRLNNNVSKSRESSLPTPKSTSVSSAKRDGAQTTGSGSRRSVADSVTARLSGAKRSQVADLKSRDSDSNEGSSESLNNSKNLQSNMSKSGGLSNARPNRTFELRRARTGSIDSDTSLINTPRSNGVKGSARSNRSNNTTEVSLGAKIVQKSRENGSTDNRASHLKRNDGGRYSMRATSTTNKSSTSTQSKPSSAKSTPGSAGVKKPTTRGHSSNSLLARAEREKEAEKEKEKAAWDRRRTYDPRKAVQQAKARKADSRGATPNSSNEEAALSSRPRANSYSGENASIVSNAPPLSSHQYNGTADTRHSADVFQPMESDTLKLNLEKENDMEGSGHELEIAKLSYNLAKDLEMLSNADGDIDSSRYDEYAEVHTSQQRRQHRSSREKVNHLEASPDTEELVESMFACQQSSSSQQQKSAFCSYRSAASVTPEMPSPALSPMRKKLSSSQNLENHRSPSAVENSYNNLVLTSIQQLSGKLHNYTSNTVGRLRERGVSVSASPSPTEQLDEDMPASSELASILKTLKRVEQNVKLMDKALFTSVPQSDFSTVSNNEHEHYLAEIKRIRNEIAGFKPIDTTTQKPTSNVTKVPPKVASKPANNKTRTAGGNTAVKSNTSSYKRSVFY